MYSISRLSPSASDHACINTLNSQQLLDNVNERVGQALHVVTVQVGSRLVQR